MRILHVVPSYFPAVRYGGPIFSVHGLCRALSRLGHEVHVFTTDADGDESLAVPLGTPQVLDGVNVQYFPISMVRRLFFAPDMARALKRQLDAFDVLHTHSVFLWPTWAAAVEARRKAIPQVLSPRGMLVKDLISRRSALAKTLWIRAIERTNLQGAASIHVTSEEEARQLARFHFELRSVDVIPNGVDAAPPSPTGTAYREGPARASCEPLLLFVGRLNWKKGLDRLIRALVHVPNATLVIAGNDEDDYAATLKSLSRELGVERRIRFAGPVYGDAKAALFAQATLTILPSYSENFGNVVLEAMAAGCPVAVTPEVGASSIVVESGAGEVLRGDPPELGRGIARMLGDLTRLRQMGAMGKAAVEQRYSWDAVARLMTTLYERVAVARREGPVVP